MTTTPDPSPAFSADDFLGAQLRDAAASFDLPAGAAEPILEKGAARRRRSRGLLSASVVGAVAIASGSVIVLGAGNAKTPLEAAGAGGEAAAPEGGPTSWRRVDPTSALGYATSLTGGDDRYALSTAPGKVAPEAQPVRAIYRSDDGVNWQQVRSLGDDLKLSGVSAGGSKVYAVGTGTATAGSSSDKLPDLFAALSEDGAKTFSRTSLPLDMAAIAKVAKQVTFGQTQVAVSGSDVVATSVVGVELDVARVLPKGLTTPNGYALTETGIDVLGPRKGNPCPAGTTSEGGGSEGQEQGNGLVYPYYCGGKETGAATFVSPQDAQGVTRHVSWSEAGVAGDARSAVLRKPVSFAAKVGSKEFHRIEVPSSATAGPLGYTNALLSGDEGGIRLVLETSSNKPDTAPALQLLELTSGTWTDAPTPAGLRGVMASGTFAGRTVLVGQAGDKPVVAREDGLGGWKVSDLATAVAAPAGAESQVTSAAVGRFGVVAVVAVIETTGASVDPPAAGVPATVAPASADARKRALAAKNGGVVEETKVRTVVASTRDGQGWQADDLDGLVGGKTMQVVRTTVGAEQAQLAVAVGDPTTNVPAKQVVLVGTPG